MWKAARECGSVVQGEMVRKIKKLAMSETNTSNLVLVGARYCTEKRVGKRGFILLCYYINF